MSPLSNKGFIGFPPRLLLDRPLRVPIIAETKEWIALNKPTCTAVRQHPWNGGASDMDTALNKQLQAQKPELVERGATLFGSVYNLDLEISGVTLFAKQRDSLRELRNLVGSEKFRFRFLMVAKTSRIITANEFVVDAPLLIHNTKPKMIPSTARGKKTWTHFSQVYESSLGWSLWEASTRFPRFHQIRAHAAVGGIAALGDSLYAGPDIPSLGELMPRKRIAEMRKPIFDGIALHLSEVLLPMPEENSEETQLNAIISKPFKFLLKRLQLEYSK